MRSSASLQDTDTSTSSFKLSITRYIKGFLPNDTAFITASRSSSDPTTQQRARLFCYTPKTTNYCMSFCFYWKSAYFNSLKMISANLIRAKCYNLRRWKTSVTENNLQGSTWGLFSRQKHRFSQSTAKKLRQTPLLTQLSISFKMIYVSWNYKIE